MGEKGVWLAGGAGYFSRRKMPAVSIVTMMVTMATMPRTSLAASGTKVKGLLAAVRPWATMR